MFVVTDDYEVTIEVDRPIRKSLRWGTCPGCSELVIDSIISRFHTDEIVNAERLYPVIAISSPLPSDIPEAIADEYREAAKLRTISPRASAALARRCLQLGLRANGFRAKNLVKEIEKAEADSRCSSSLIAKLHAVRIVGNYTAHATEDENGNFLSVEPDELDLLFATIEEFFDVFYVKPKQHERQMAAVKRKVEAAKKPSGAVANDGS